MNLELYEAQLTDELLEKLIALSRDWAAEQSCHGYRENGRADIEGNRIFLAREEGEILGYLFGKIERSKKASSVMPEGTPCFEVEELYVIPARRSEGIGTKLFSFTEAQVKSEAEYLTLGTATKNWRAILHFYLEEVGMTFWSARLFKKID